MSKKILFAITILVLGAPVGIAEETIPNWEQVTRQAAWQARDSQGEVVFDDKLWVLGGWFNSYAAPPRDVWSSADGKDWKLVTQQAPWKHSDLPMTLVFRDKMWLMGGGITVACPVTLPVTKSGPPQMVSIGRR